MGKEKINLSEGIVKIILFIVLSTSIILIFSNNLILNKLMILITFLCVCLIIKKHNEVFFIFLITCCSWGASLNLENRFNSIMPTDLFLILLILSIIINSLNKKINCKKFFFSHINIFILFVIIIFIILGVVKGYYFYNIFQDFKLFLYFYIPYIYLVSININKNFELNIINFCKIYIMLIFIQEVWNIVQIGLDNMVSNGFGQRDVGIIVPFIPLIISIVFLYKNKIRKVEMIVLQFMGAIACIISFTRTVWIAYIAAILILVFFKDRNFIKLLRNIIMLIIILIIVNLILSEFLPNLYINFENAIISRLTDSTNSVNTLDHRFNSASLHFNEMVLRVDSIWGSGFGEIWQRKGAVFVENSLFYYIWKYGIFFTFYLVYIIIRNLYKAFCSKFTLVKVISLNLLVFVVIGNFSGNLNIYYFMPVISFIFAYPYIFKNYIKQF